MTEAQGSKPKVWNLNPESDASYFEIWIQNPALFLNYLQSYEGGDAYKRIKPVASMAGTSK